MRRLQAPHNILSCLSVCRPCSTLSSPTSSLPNPMLISKVKAVAAHPYDLSIFGRLDVDKVGFAKLAVHKRLMKSSTLSESGEKGRELTDPFHLKARRHVSIMGTWDDEVVRRLHQSPQLVLVGRSNVGKSSLLNSMLGFNSTYVQRAAVSGRPGETRSLDFYSLGRQQSSQLLVGDVPGYGFSYLNERDREQTQQILLRYLSYPCTPGVWKRVLLLVDARHGLKSADLDFLRHMSAAPPCSPSFQLQLIYTKCDLQERTLLARLMSFDRDVVLPRALSSALRKRLLPPHALSAITGGGLGALRRDVAAELSRVHRVGKDPMAPSASHGMPPGRKRAVFLTLDAFLAQPPTAELPR
eukprot:gene29802-35983_t